MRDLVIVDHSVIAEGLCMFLRSEMGSHASTIRDDPCRSAPHDALVLVELFLPNGECGLAFARRLQKSRPDLTPILWTINPRDALVWAALEHKIPGFLGKELSSRDLLYWLQHALARRAAWPGEFMVRAHNWEQEVAPRLNTLTDDLWLLWAGLLRRESSGELCARLAWSARTFERRSAELYATLDVQRRADAISLGWEWGLVRQQGSRLEWNSAIRDLFTARRRQACR